MFRMELTDEEHDELLRVLRSCVNNLAVEIVHTDHADFRRMLRRREAVVTQLLEKIEKREPAEVA